MDPQQQGPQQQQAPPDLAAMVQHLAALQQQQVQAQQQHQQQVATMMEQLAGVSAAVEGLAQSAASSSQPEVPQPQPSPSRAAPALCSFKLPKPAMFTGRAPQELPAWLFTMETFLRNSGLDLETPAAAAGAACYLQHSAMVWYEAAVKQAGGQNPHATFGEFKAALTAFFQPIDPSVTARDCLMSFQQTGGYKGYAASQNASRPAHVHAVPVCPLHVPQAAPCLSRRNKKPSTNTHKQHQA